MPELTASTREAARRIGLSDTAIHKAERAGRITREPDGNWDIDKTRRRLTETADPARSPLANSAEGSRGEWRSTAESADPHTIADLAGIRDRVGSAQGLGYTMAVEEFQIGILSLAAPILARDREPTGAIQITASSVGQNPQDMAERFGPLVAEAARTIGES